MFWLVSRFGFCALTGYDRVVVRKLPIGIQTFAEIIEKDAVYVDKTRFLYTLASGSAKNFFLSRPRRFGKSLTISTLDALFNCKRDLFKGLWIDTSDYQWKAFPVLRFDFSEIGRETPEQLTQGIQHVLGRYASTYSIELDTRLPVSTQLGDLVRALSKDIGKAVVLIDEYDKPMLDAIEEPDKARANREVLRNFYGVLKSLDEHLRFVFLTGVTKFSQVSVFSGLNNLQDLTLDSAYGALCGYTQEELEHYFAEHLKAFGDAQGLTREETLEKFKFWYNGYQFSDSPPKVYNPFSTLNSFSQNKFLAKWFESGTPTFLLKQIEKSAYNVPNLDNVQLSPPGFSAADIDNMNIETLLFQTGYLTIASHDRQWDLYTLDFPNFEVKNGFYTHLTEYFAGLGQGTGGSLIRDMIVSLRKEDLNGFFSALETFFANIPYTLQSKADEKYYQSLFHSVMVLVGLNVPSEVHTNKGRIDTVIELSDKIYIFEFKIVLSAAEPVEAAKDALAQIQNRGYAQKYRASGKAIHQIGAAFDRGNRNIGAWVSA